MAGRRTGCAASFGHNTNGVASLFGRSTGAGAHRWRASKLWSLEVAMHGRLHTSPCEPSDMMGMEEVELEVGGQGLSREG